MTSAPTARSDARKRRGALAAVAGVALAGSMVLVGPGNFGIVGAADPVKILPLGNSLTQGVENPGGFTNASADQSGYRGRLEDRFDEVGFDFDFIGTQSSGSNFVDDTDHEGVSGEDLDMINSRVNSSNVQALDPDVVLLMGGTNDLTDPGVAFGAAPGALADMATLLDTVTDSWPDAKVIVAKVPQFKNASNSDQNRNVAAFNAGLQGVVNTENANNGDTDITVVDMFRAITNNDIAGGDTVHPNKFGYGKMADVWFQGLEPLFPELTPAQADPVVTDDFNRADATLGAAPTGQTWVTSTNDGGSLNPVTFGVVSNKAEVTGGQNEGIATVDAGVDDVDVKVDIEVSTAAGAPSLALRADDADNQLIAQVRWGGANNRLTLAKIQGSSVVTLEEILLFFPDADADGTADAPSGTYELRAVLDGNSVEIWFDGVRWIDHTLSGADNTFFEGNTRFGIRARTPGEDGNSTWDNFVLRDPSLPPPPPPTTDPPPGGDDGFNSIEPERAGDSRVSPGSKVPAGGTFTVDVSDYASAGDVIAVNLTVAGAAGIGFATLYACGADQPDTSSLNFFGPNPIANGVITEVGTSGTVCVFMSQEGHVILDVFGDFPSDGFTAIGPERAADSRQNPGSKVAAGSTFVVDVSDVASAGDALAVNLTVAGAAAIGFATMYACGQDQPDTSSLNFFGPNPIANGVITEVGTSGTICVFMSQEGHVILDVFGELDGDLFTAIGPERAADSRQNPGSKVAAGSTFVVDVSDVASAGDALAVNLTVAGAAAIGFATMYACGQDQPDTSSLNFFGPNPIANGVITEVGTSGTICVFMSQEGHVILDVFGEVATS